MSWKCHKTLLGLEVFLHTFDIQLRRIPGVCRKLCRSWLASVTRREKKLRGIYEPNIIIAILLLVADFYGNLGLFYKSPT